MTTRRGSIATPVAVAIVVTERETERRLAEQMRRLIIELEQRERELP